MAINKARTSTGTKAVLIILIVAFVVSFISIGAGLFSSAGTTDTTTSGDPLAQVNAQYQPTVASITSQLQSQPESYTVLVALGNTYFDWGAAAQQVAQTNQAAAGADQPLWVAAKDAYSRALKVRNDESPVRTDYAITLFYTGDTNEAIAVATKVTEDDPTFASAYFNLGIFFRALGQNDKALAAFEKAIELDPDGKQTNAEFAKQAISELKSSAETSPTP